MEPDTPPMECYHPHSPQTWRRNLKKREALALVKGLNKRGRHHFKAIPVRGDSWDILRYQ